MSNNNSTGQISPTQFDAQFILIVIAVVLQLFQTVVTGIKLRVKCRHCFCSVRPKNSSPDSNGGSPQRPDDLREREIKQPPLPSSIAPAVQDQGGRLEVSLTPRTAAAVVAAFTAVAVPGTSVSEGSATPTKRESAPITRSRTLSNAAADFDYTPTIVRRCCTPASSNMLTNKGRLSVPTINLESIVIDKQ